MSKACWESFVLGLYETDGVSGKSIGFTLTNKDFLIALSRLLSAMGISSSLYNSVGDVYHLGISGARSRNRFLDIIKGVATNVHVNMQFATTGTNRSFDTRKAFLAIRNGVFHRSDYKKFGRFGSKYGKCTFEK